MLSPLQTRRHWLCKANLEAHDHPDKAQDFCTNISLHHWKAKELWHVRLSVSIEAKSKTDHSPYTGTVEYEGVFEVADGFPPDTTEALVRMNGGAVLYGAARELFLGLTSRSKNGPFELPTIDARMLIKPPASKKKATKKSAKKKSAKKKKAS